VTSPHTPRDPGEREVDPGVLRVPAAPSGGRAKKASRRGSEGGRGVAPEALRCLFRGREVLVKMTGLDDRGDPYTGAGYRMGTVRAGKSIIHGRVSWLGGRFIFTPVARTGRGG